MSILLAGLHVFVSVFLIIIVLLQRGKGASLGSTFGGGSSHTLFGSSAGNFLTKMTTGAAIIFMLTSLGMSIISSNKMVKTITPPAKVLKDEPKKDATATTPATETPAVTPAPATDTVGTTEKPTAVPVETK